MNISRPIAVVLVTTITLLMSHSSASAQTREAAIVPMPAEDAQISGSLPNSRAGAVTMQRLTGDPSVTYGALPSIGFTTWFDDHYWNDNFYQVDAFVPLNLNPGVDFFYTHFAVSATSDGKGVGNLGLGYGRYFEGLDRLVRTTAYLDIDGQPTETQTRVALQMENLGEYVDIRSELGIVLSDQFNVASQGFTGTAQFSEHRILLDAIRRTETSFHHANVEMGGPLAFLGQYGINVYGQAYYLWETDTNRDTIGGRVRGEWQVTEDITFNVHHSKDSIFDSSTWFNLVLTTPDGPPKHLFSQVPVRERFTKRPVRDGRVPTVREVSRPVVLGINPQTGQPYNIIHVDGNAGGPGDGTFENPYFEIDLARTNNAPEFDVILVTANTTNPRTNMQLASTLNLFDNQQLLSRSVDQFLPVQNFGNFFLPGSGGPLPILQNLDIVPSSVISLANFNTVSGFGIDGGDLNDLPIHTGIIGGTPGTPITGFNINRNEIFNVINGVVIEHEGDALGYFDDNEVTGIGVNSLLGFSVTHSLGALGLSVQRNTVTAFEGQDANHNGVFDIGEDGNEPGVGIQIIANNASTINAYDPDFFPPPLIPVPGASPEFGIRDNVVTANGTGMLMQSNEGSVINADVSDNTFSGNLDPQTGARFEAISSTINLLAFNRNTVEGNSGNGLTFFADDPLAQGSGLINIFDMQFNTIVGNGFLTTPNLDGTNNNGILMLAENGSTIVADTSLVGFGLTGLGITDNDISGNAGSGFLAIARDGGFGLNSGSALFLELTPGTDAGNLGNTIDNNGLHGFNVVLDNGSLGVITVYNSYVRNNGGFGFGAQLDNASGLFMTIGEFTTLQSNTFDNNVGAGIGIYAANDSFATGTIRGNFIRGTNNDNDVSTPFAGEGIAIFLDEASLINTIIDRNRIGDATNPALGNASHGLWVSTTGTSANGIFGLLIGNNDAVANNGNVIGFNNGDGIRFERNVDAIVDNVGVIDNIVRNNTGNGLHVIARGTNNDPFDITVNQNSFLFNGLNGVRTHTFADANIFINMDGNVINNNGQNGILTVETTNSIFDLRDTFGLWQNNVISGNEANGVYFSAAASSGLFLDNNTIQANGLNGILSDAPGNYFFTNNRIIGNGVSNVVGSNHGIDIEGFGFKTVTMSNNIVDFNFGDGLEFNNNDTGIDDGFTNEIHLTSVNDRFRNNRGRGIDILVQGDAESTISFDGAHVLNNLVEGVYVVVTASTTQGQDAAPGAALAANGSVEADPWLGFAFTNGRIEGNGVNSGFSTTGMLLRVGTSEFRNANNFASDGDSGLFAIIDNNSMQGNLGDDFYVDAFISTVNPTGVPARDPLARLDLIFTNNTGDSVDVDPANFAIFYDNSSIERSPWDLTRRRNATRLADDGFIWNGIVTVATSNVQFNLQQFEPGAGNFFAGGANGFAGRVLTFLNGPLNGESQTVTSNTAAGQFNFAIGFSGPPVVNNLVSVDFSSTLFPGLGDSTFRRQISGNTFSNGMLGFSLLGSADIRTPVPRQGELPSVWGLLP